MQAAPAMSSAPRRAPASSPSDGRPGHGHLHFKVMPDQPADETLRTLGYRVETDFIEALLVRTSTTAAASDPAHVVFLSALGHYQKMLYVYACHALGLGYDPDGTEKLRIGPARLDVRMPPVLRQADRLVHRMVIDVFEPLGERRYRVVTRSEINRCLQVTGETTLCIL